MVSISACHADDPGSIPGRGVIGIGEWKSRVGVMLRVDEKFMWLFGLVV